jgi:hypothetical protein
MGEESARLQMERDGALEREEQMRWGTKFPLDYKIRCFFCVLR